MSKVGDSTKKFHVNASGLLGAESLDNLTSSLEKSFASSPRSSPSKPRKNRKETLMSPAKIQNPPPPVAPMFSPSHAEFSKKLGKLTEKLSFGSPRTAAPVVDPTTSPKPKYKGTTKPANPLPPPRLQESNRSPRSRDTPNSSIQGSPESKRKGSLHDRCVFCDLPLLSMLLYNPEATDPEGVIELVCAHSSHEKCLLLEMEFVNTAKIPPSEPSVANYFPSCPKCSSSVKAVPASQTIADQLITNILTVPMKKPEPIHSIPLFRQPGSQNSSANSSPRVLQRAKGDPWTPRGEILPHRHAKKPSRGSSISAVSSIISSVSVGVPFDPETLSSSAFDGSKIQSAWTSEFPIYLLRSKFLSELVLVQKQKMKSIKFDKPMIDSFGDLRLLDKLRLSQDGISWNECYCYLFERMFLTLDLDASRIGKLTIDQSLTSEIPSPTVVKFQTANATIHLTCSDSEVVEKWGVALANLNTEFPSGLITSTVKEDEFYPVLQFEDSKETRPPRKGVNPRFYESTINSLDFGHKPSKMVIVVNQLTPSPHSLVSIKNIVRSLSMVKIDISMVFTSSLHLNLGSKVLDTLEMLASDDGDDKELLLNKVDEYQNLLQVITPTADETKAHWEEDSMLGSTLNNILETDERHKDQDITTVVLSASSLSGLADLPTARNIFIEISTSPEMANGGKRASIFNVTGWEDAMEAICAYIGLEFDDSDFDNSSDDSDDEEAKEPLTLGDTEFLPEKIGDNTRWSTLLKSLDKALEETKGHK
ncbi:hypothetical protein OGAPHI_002721 [Ogataea philodendri]|uniref:PH domain-containing protein n=1 Tax=Ogataea philodendri TaxID=1378263 RepID=A0A9P8PBY1_9ASCO|nr:uncharacterized protein OGAPHI_002721 [Ogataea philodendri]KAH3668966.1 hypothetical protein OGAPHI_002721 [Ogataea philodendri]